MHDYVIAGAGSAGCVLAGRLTEDSRTRVLLLEAGPADRKQEIRIPAAFSKLFRTDYDWNYSTLPQPALDGRSLYWPRGRTLGGCSSINAHMYLRGRPQDYDGWAAGGNRGWAFQDVLPVFVKMERYERGSSRLHGYGGPLNVSDLRDPNPTSLAFLRACREIGIRQIVDPNGEEGEGASLTPVTQKRGRRWSAADAYLRPAVTRPNLTVVTGAQVARLVFENSRAVGVEYVKDGRMLVARAAREVVVSCGAVNSPHLLMISGVGPAEQLREHGVSVVRDLPGVGANLQDHLAVAVIVTVTQPVTLVAAESIGNLLRYLLFRRGMLTSNVGEGCAFLRTQEHLGAPDLELVFAPVPFVDHGLVKQTRHGMTIGVVCLQPKSAGSIALASKDPFAPPAIQPSYLTDPEGEDLRVLLHGVKLARRIFRTEALSAYTGEALEPGPGVERDEDIVGFIRSQAETLYHPVGTCRMGDDARAVVDAELRVHGVEGLRVVDASVMPAIPRGHTNGPTIMIAEKAAELMRAGAI
jgi:choline dehydrogenase